MPCNVSAQTLKCAYCGETITGNYVTAESKIFHPEHFICGICGKPIEGNYTKDSGEYLHPECFRDVKVPKCSVCGKPLIGEYWIDAFQNKYHPFHDKEFSKCSNCGRLICPFLTGGGKSYGDGRSMCKICYQTAVFSDSEIKNQLNTVKSALNSMGINYNSASIRVQGVGLYELKRLLGNQSNDDLQGFCKSERNTFSGKTTSITHTIYVLNGLPLLTLQTVMAHELMHAWIFENSVSEKSSSEVEGSCNYIAYRYLQKISGPESIFLQQKFEKNTDPVYGKGFQNIRLKFQGKNIPELLSFFKQ